MPVTPTLSAYEIQIMNNRRDLMRLALLDDIKAAADELKTTTPQPLPKKRRSLVRRKSMAFVSSRKDPIITRHFAKRSSLSPVVRLVNFNKLKSTVDPNAGRIKFGWNKPRNGDNQEEKNEEDEEEIKIYEDDDYLTLEKAHFWGDFEQKKSPPKRRFSYHRADFKKSGFKSVDDVTEGDLSNVADFVSIKVYDQTHGTSCHQCRQKTIDTKTECRSGFCVGVRGQFCGVCLRNRYGEDAKAALKNPEWKCPPCRGVCNCSICRNRSGKRATGILTPTVIAQGYGSVKDYLLANGEVADPSDDEEEEKEEEGEKESFDEHRATGFNGFISDDEDKENGNPSEDEDKENASDRG